MDAIPHDLLCPLCQGVILDAVMSPCCAVDICEDCGKSGIILGNGKCPLQDCNETAHLEDLIPNRLLRKKATEFRASHPELVEKVNRIPPPKIPELFPTIDTLPLDIAPDSPGPVFQAGVCIPDRAIEASNDTDVQDTLTSDTSLNLLVEEENCPIDPQRLEKSCDNKDAELSDVISSTTKIPEGEEVLKAKKKKKKKDKDKHSDSKSPEKNDLSSSKNSKASSKSKEIKAEETPGEAPIPGEEKPAVESALNHKLEIAPNLLQEAGTDPLSVFNKLMAAKDKDKCLTNPGSSIHYGVTAPQSIPTYAGGIYYPPPPLGYYPGATPHYSMYIRPSQQPYPYQDRSRTVQSRTFRSRSSYDRRHYDDKPSSFYRRDLDKRRDARKSKSPREYTPTTKKISRASSSGSGSSRSSSSSSSSVDSEKKKNDKPKTTKKKNKSKSSKDDKAKKSDKSPLRTSKTQDEAQGKGSRGRRENSSDKDRYRSSRRSRSRSRDTSRRRRSRSRERTRKRERSYSQENGRRHRNRSSDGERGRSGSRDRQIRSRSREGGHKDNSRSRHRGKSRDKDARSAAYDKVSKILKTLVKYKESEHKENKKEKKRSKKDKKEKHSKEIKSPVKEVHQSPRASPESLGSNQENIPDEAKDTATEDPDPTATNVDSGTKESTETMEAVIEDSKILVEDPKIKMAENDPSPSLSEKVGRASQERSPKKLKTSSTDSSDSESVSELGSTKNLKAEKKLKRGVIKDHNEADGGLSPLKAEERQDESERKVSDEEPEDDHVKSKTPKRDNSESKQSDASTKSDEKMRLSKSKSKDKDEEIPSSTKLTKGPSSSERLKVAQRLMSKVRQVSQDLYHDDDFRILIEDFIRPPKGEPEVSKKNKLKRAKKRSYDSESDASSDRSFKEQPKKRLKSKKDKKKKKKKRSTTSSDDEVSASNSPSVSKKDKASKIDTGKRKSREKSPSASYQNGS